MEPVTIAAIAGVGALGLVALRLRAVAKKNPSGGSSSVPLQALPLTPANVQLIKTQTLAELKAGTAKLSTTGVPFQVKSPFDPSLTPAQLLDKNGNLDILPTDQITVDAKILASTLVTGGQGLPGIPDGNVIMEVASLVDPKRGPVMAISKDPRLAITEVIAVPPSAITGVMPADAAAAVAAAVGG